MLAWVLGCRLGWLDLKPALAFRKLSDGLLLWQERESTVRGPMRTDGEPSSA
jgi:hypothetical protein